MKEVSRVKRLSNRGKVIAVCFAAIFIGCVWLISHMLQESNELREFKVDLFVLCYESDICVSTSDSGDIKVDPENQQALYALMLSTYGYYTVGEPEARDSINMDFKCHDEEWHLTIEDVGVNKLRVTLDGPRSYKLYLKNNNKFDSFKRAVSVNGYKTNNKVIGG